ncbi:MAG: endonuclease III [Candidatus Micrarchaeota archaeon]
MKNNGKKSKIIRINKLLGKEYGKEKPWKLPPLDALVNVILSQNTNDVNSGKAFKKLKAKYRNWGQLLSAPEKEIARTIKVGGLANIKAKRIKKVLMQINKRVGKLDLGSLRDYSPSDARNYLMQFDGIGPKSAAVVVAFAFGKPAFPIDTHIFRVLKRIPLMPEKMGYMKAHEYMEKTVPDKLKIPLHVQMIAHGRKICRARKPQCSKCVLRRMCKKVGVGIRG